MAQTVKCPECGKSITLVTWEKDPTKLVGVCDCRGRVVEVYLTDNPEAVQAAEIKPREVKKGE